MVKFDATNQVFRMCTDVENDKWDAISFQSLAEDTYCKDGENVDYKFDKVQNKFVEVDNKFTQVNKNISDLDNKKQDKATAITTSNIGQQHVAYADKAGTADTVKNIHWNDISGKPDVVTKDNMPNYDDRYYVKSKTYSKDEVNGKFGKFLPLSGGTMTGRLSMGGNNLTGVYGLYGKDNLYLKSSNNSYSVVIGGNALNVVHNSGIAPEPWADILCDHVHYHGGLVNDSYSKVKKNIKKINDKEAKKILEVPIYTFDYINGYGNNAKNQIGTLYDDIKDIIPNATYVPDGWDEETFDIETANPMEDYVPGVSYIDLIPYLIAMIQIQQKEIDELKVKIETLEN